MEAFHRIGYRGADILVREPGRNAPRHKKGGKPVAPRDSCKMQKVGEVFGAVGVALRRRSW